MINHVRTLLMNRTREGYPQDYPGEEYIQPDFIPKKLRLELQLIHRQLFGVAPDRLFLNYRVRQLLTIMHSTELVEFIYDFDPRVTYTPLVDDESLFDEVFVTTVRQVAGSGNTLYVSGEHVTTPGDNRLQQTWDVIVTEDAIRVDKRSLPTDSVLHPANYNGGLSNLIPLVGSGLSVRIKEAPINTRWTINSAAQPVDDVGQVLAQLESSISDGGFQLLFPITTQEPLTTLKNIWNRNHLSAYRYTALLLATVYQINEMPQDS